MLNMTKSLIKKIGYLFILFLIVNCNNIDPLMNMSLDQLKVHLEELKDKRNQDPSNENLLEEYLITKYLLDPNSKIPENLFVNTESLRERFNFLHNISDVDSTNNKCNNPDDSGRFMDLVINELKGKGYGISGYYFSGNGFYNITVIKPTGRIGSSEVEVLVGECGDILKIIE